MTRSKSVTVKISAGAWSPTSPVDAGGALTVLVLVCARTFLVRLSRLMSSTIAILTPLHEALNLSRPLRPHQLGVEQSLGRCCNRFLLCSTSHLDASLCSLAQSHAITGQPSRLGYHSDQLVLLLGTQPMERFPEDSYPFQIFRL